MSDQIDSQLKFIRKDEEKKGKEKNVQVVKDSEDDDDDIILDFDNDEDEVEDHSQQLQSQQSNPFHLNFNLSNNQNNNNFNKNNNQKSNMVNQQQQYQLKQQQPQQNHPTLNNQDKNDQRLNQWQNRKQTLLQLRQSINSKKMHNESNLSYYAMSPPQNLNTYSQNDNNSGLNQPSSYFSTNQKIFHQNQIDKQQQKQKDEENVQYDFQFTLENIPRQIQMTEHRQEKELSSFLPIDKDKQNIVKTMEDQHTALLNETPQKNIGQNLISKLVESQRVENTYETNQTPQKFNENKKSYFNEIVTSTSNNNNKNIKIKKNNNNNDEDEITQRDKMIARQLQSGDDSKGRISIGQYIQESGSRLMNKSKSLRQSIFIKKDQNNSPMTSVNGHNQEIINTKMMMKKARKNQNKFTAQIKNIQRIMKRILTLIQIKRLFTKQYQLSALQYALISDKAYHQSSINDDKNFFKHFQILASHLNKPLLLIRRLLQCKGLNKFLSYVIRPDSKFNLAWMIIQVLVYFVFLSIVSVGIFFSDEIFSTEPITGSGMRIFNVMFIFIMTLLDIIKELSCGYYECGEIVVDRQKICLKYLKSTRFIYDILSSFSLLTEIFSQELKYEMKIVFQIIKMLVFFKISLINDAIKKIESQFLFSSSWNNWIHLLKLSIIVLFTCHIMAILYYGQALLQIRYMDASNTWLDMAKLLDEPSSGLRYIQSLYNATCLMVAAIQYNPKEPLESIFVTLATIANTAYFGFIVTAIGAIVEDFKKSSKEQRKELASMNQFMIQTKIPRDLQIRVRSYLEYNHALNQSIDSEEANTILTKLPLKIKNEVVSVVNSSYLSQIPVINDNFSQKFISLILIKMEQVKFIPGEIIFKEKKKDDMGLYFILEGKVDIYLRNRSVKDISDRQEYVIKELTKGQYFGEFSFFSGYTRSASAKASSYCTLVKIKREDFLETLQYSHEDFEIFRMKQDQLNLYQQMSAINLNCAICQNGNHLAKDCNSIHIAPYHHTIINVYNRQSLQEREPQVLRNNKQKFNPLNNMHSLIANAIIIAENYSNFFHEQYSPQKNKGQQMKNNLYQVNENEQSGDCSPQNSEDDKDDDNLDMDDNSFENGQMSQNGFGDENGGKRKTYSQNKIRQQKQPIFNNKTVNTILLSEENEEIFDECNLETERKLNNNSERINFQLLQKKNTTHVNLNKLNNPKLQKIKSRNELTNNKDNTKNLNQTNGSKDQNSQNRKAEYSKNKSQIKDIFFQEDYESKTTNEEIQYFTNLNNNNNNNHHNIFQDNQDQMKQVNNIPQIISCESELVKMKSAFQQSNNILSNQVVNVSKIRLQVDNKKQDLSQRSRQKIELYHTQSSKNKDLPQQNNFIDEIEEFTQSMDLIKSFDHYYPDHNFYQVVKQLITKKVIHTNKINVLINQVNKINQAKQKNQIKMILFNQELKKNRKNSEFKKNKTQKSRFISKSLKLK